METTYINCQKALSYKGKCYPNTEVLADAITHHEWAEKTLAAPDVVYPNGRHSHDCASEQLEAAETALSFENSYFVS